MHDRRHKYRPSMTWAEIRPGVKAAEFRDNQLRLIEPFTDYVLEVVNSPMNDGKSKRSYQSRLEEAAYTLSDFSNFLGDKDITWKDVGDSELVQYKEWSFDRTRSGGRSKTKNSVQRTVNGRLKFLYRFYMWAQEDAYWGTALIGWTDCQIRSSLILLRNSGNVSEAKESLMYPLLYRGAGSKSHDGEGKYWATEEDINCIEQYFWDSFPADVAERNIVIMRIVQYMGWRPGSVNSLTIEMFSKERIEAALKKGLEYFYVEPPTQKLNRGFTFDTPFEIAQMILHYIDGARPRLLEGMKNVSEGAIFTSVRTGMPLADNSLSKIFTKAFRAIGAPPDSGLRSIRRSFSEEALRSEIEFRKSEGYSLAFEDVSAAVARKMGQTSIFSQAPYQRAMNQTRRTSIEQVQRNSLAAKDAELMALRSEKARLEELLRSISTTKKA